MVRRGDDGPNVDLCGWPRLSPGTGAILCPLFVPPQVSVIVHGATLVSFSLCQRRPGTEHTTSVSVFGDEGGSAFFVYSGSLFNHVPSTSQARLMKQERTVFAGRNSKSSGKSVEGKAEDDRSGVCRRLDGG